MKVSDVCMQVDTSNAYVEDTELSAATDSLAHGIECSVALC
jgi:hypothetical protein